MWTCTLKVVQSNRTQTALMWKSTFDQIFGQQPAKSSPLTDTQLMRSMVLLHEAAKNIDSIDQRDQEKLQLWFGKVFGFTAINGNTQDCNAGYVRGMTELYQRQNIANNPNFHQIYITFIRNIIQFCESHFADLISRLASEVPLNKLLDLLNSYTINKRECFGRDLAKRLTKPLLHSVDVSMISSGPAIVRSSIENPCGTILSTINQPEMKAYTDFVDMCLFGSRDILLHCSEPILIWVSIIDMCKNLAQLTPFIAENIDREVSQAEDMWKSTYHEIFGPVTVSPLTEPQLYQSLMFLYAKADRFASINVADKRIVKFWHNALIEFNIYDCTVDNVQRMSTIYAQHNIVNNPNFKNVYVNFRATLIRYCDHRFADLPGRLSSRVIDQNLLNYLREQAQHDNHSSLFLQDLGERLADPAIRSFEAGHREARVLEAWKQGTCEKILTTLRQQNMKEYSEFISMSLLDRGKYLKHCARPSQIWMIVVDVCNKLTGKIPSFVGNNFSLRISIRTFLMFLNMQT